MAERRVKKRLPLGRQSALIAALAAVGLALLLIGRTDLSKESETTVNEAQDWQEYVQILEEKAASLCSRVAGVSDVTVALSLTQGVEYVYAEDEGGYLLTGSGASACGLLLTERPPQVSGIGVVCVGADDPETVQTLLSLLSAAFGVGTNRIYITSAG